MRNIKKALIFVISISLIFAFANFSLASSITARNSTNASENSSTQDNTSDNSTDDSSDNTSSTTSSSSSNRVTSNSSSSLNSVSQSSSSTSTSKTINTSNSSENLPKTGIDKTSFNFAMILLLALVLSMFSLVQYNKISKKDE